MIKYFSSFFLCCYFSLTAVIPADLSLSQKQGIALASQSFPHPVIYYARQYRFDSSLLDEQEQKREKELVEKAFDTLVHYDTCESLEEAVIKLVVDALSVHPHDFSIIDAKKAGLGGRSSDRVFMIKDHQGQFCYAVKAFKNPQQMPSKFLYEISALNFIEQLNLPHMGTIYPLAFARYRDQNQQWGLLLESLAQGKRIDHSIAQLAEQSLNTKQRQLDLDLICKAFHQMGKTFASFHRITSANLASIPSDIVEKYEKQLSQILDDSIIVNELSNHVSLSHFIQVMEEIKQAALHTPVVYTYFHGDAHLGNLFYNDEQDLVFFIDVAKMHQSIDLYNFPLSDGTVDLLWIEDSFLRHAIGRLTKEEINILLQKFYESYEMEQGQLPDENLLLFYRTYTRLDRLMRYSGSIKGDESAEQVIEKKLFDDAVNYFKTLINLNS